MIVLVRVIRFCVIELTLKIVANLQRYDANQNDLQNYLCVHIECYALNLPIRGLEQFHCQLTFHDDNVAC